MAERDDDVDDNDYYYDSKHMTEKDDHKSYSSPPAKRIKLGKWLIILENKTD
jgi:hypothetical protein